MTKIMLAILEAYASDDRRHLDYSRIAASEEFRRWKRTQHILAAAQNFRITSSVDVSSRLLTISPFGASGTRTWCRSSSGRT